MREIMGVKFWALLCFALLLSSSNANAQYAWEENDWISEAEFEPTKLFLYATDPEALPKSGETQNDVDKRLGPWLELNKGGIAVGAPQGTVVTNPDGTTTGAYGILVDGSQLPASGLGFRRLSRRDDKTWGTGFMISLMVNSSAALATEYPGITLYIGDISKPTGGFFNPPHKSHQNGLDVDVAYAGTTTFKSVLDDQGRVAETFDYEKNWRYFQMITAQRYAERGRVDSIVSMILVAPELKTAFCSWAKANGRDEILDREVLRRLRPTAGHDDHFHVRLRCSPYHASCEKSFAPPKDTGCA